MLIDSLNEFSDEQAVTATALSTNVIDLGAAVDTLDNELYLHIKCMTTATAAGAATVVFSLETDDAEAIDSASVVFTTPAIAKATLVAGYEVARIRIPAGLQQYLAVRYTVATGPLTAGAFSAFLSPSIDATYAVS